MVHHQYTLDGDIHTESSNHVDQGSSNNSDPTSGNESGGDLPYSDIDASSDADQLDIVPHQRLTINNTTALFSAHSTLTQISSSYQPFSDSQVITSSLPTVDSIIEVEDDFSREIAFYKQSLDAATQARMLLREEAASFSRPRDFFAEMVKSDDHMGKIKRKMADQAAAKKATADAKRQRDLKKFGKQVQIAKGQERNKERKSALEKIETLKRSMYFLCYACAPLSSHGPYDFSTFSLFTIISLERFTDLIISDHQNVARIIVRLPIPMKMSSLTSLLKKMTNQVM